MRLGPFFVVLFIMYISIGLLDQTLDPNLQGFGNCINITTIANVTGAVGNCANGGGINFFSLITQPYLWKDNQFLLMLIAIIFTVSAITAVASFFSRSDILTLAGLAGVFMSMGSVTIISLYYFITRNVGVFACNAGSSCGPATIIGGLTAGVIALMYAMTVMEWWLWRPTTQ